MCGLDHQIMERCRVRQTLHNCIEETSVAVILHWVSDSASDCLLHKFIDLLCFHRFEAASFTVRTLFLLLWGIDFLTIAEIEIVLGVAFK